MTTEIVLPSGRFATVRNITVNDMLVATANRVGFSSMVVMASLCCRVDDVELSPGEWAAMDYSDFVPVLEQLNRQLRSAYSTREGIA